MAAERVALSALAADPSADHHSVSPFQAGQLAENRYVAQRFDRVN